MYSPLKIKILFFIYFLTSTTSTRDDFTNRSCDIISESSTLRCFQMYPEDFSTTTFNEIIENLECIRCNLGNIPPETFDFEDNHLFTLSLKNNNITGLVPFTFVGLDYLRKLELSNNSIQILILGTFKGVKNVVILDLKRNEIRRIERNSFWELENLEHLDLSNNLIMDIYPGAFNNLNKLRLLILENNNLKTLQNEFEFPNNIEELYLGNNFLNKILEKQFKINKLLKLYLSNNNISVITRSCFNSLSNLKEIYLNNNKIIKLESNAFSGLKTIETLSLKNNSLETIPFDAFSKTFHLKTLDLSENKLKMFQFSIYTRMPELISVNISHNAINKILTGNVMKLYQLNYLDISYNNLSYLDYEELLQNAPKLILLNVNNNNLPCNIVNEMISYFDLDNFILNIDNNSSINLCNVTKESMIMDDLIEIEKLISNHNDHNYIVILYGLLMFVSVFILIIGFILYKTNLFLKRRNERNLNDLTDSNESVTRPISYESL